MPILRKHALKCLAIRDYDVYNLPSNFQKKSNVCEDRDTE